MGWNRVMTSDYSKFKLTVVDDYKLMPKDEFVYNHKGELLYFPTYNPADVPVFNYGPLFDLETIRQENKYYGIDWQSGYHVNYNMLATDCVGVPTFTHCTQDRVAEYYHAHFNEFEPLTVETVTKWFGWILFQLNNSYLQIGK